MKLSKLLMQLGVFGLAIVLGSFVGVALAQDFSITQPLEQSATIIVTDFLIYLGILKVAPKSRPSAGE